VGISGCTDYWIWIYDFFKQRFRVHNRISVAPVDLSTFADGDYEGHYDHGRFSNTAVVTIKDHKDREHSIYKNR
jgi:hypothetical protein